MLGPADHDNDDRIDVDRSSALSLHGEAVPVNYNKLRFDTMLGRRKEGMADLIAKMLRGAWPYILDQLSMCMYMMCLSARSHHQLC